MGTRGPLPKGSQPSKTRFKCPVNNCSSFMRGEKISKGGFFSESAICFLDLQISKKKYSKKLS